VRTHYVVALVLALALLVASRTEKGAAVIASGVDSVAKAVRGIRNNNPGNIRENASGGDSWRGERATNDDASFEEFETMRDGVRASAVVFRNYQRKYGLRTISQLISRWAPPTENNTTAYIAHVAYRVNVGAEAAIDLYHVDTLYAFLRAVFREECGAPAELIPAATIYDGIALA